MATVDALKKALMETLESKGVMGDLKARVRTEVFQALDDQTTVKPRLSNENLLINELIREYLIFNEYKYSDSVLVVESGQPEVQLDRKFLCKELNVADTKETVKVPLLYTLLHAFIEDRSNMPQSTREGLCRGKSKSEKPVNIVTVHGHGSV